MDIDTYDSPGEALAGIQSINSLDLPESIRTKFTALRARDIQIEVLVLTGEFIYAYRSNLPDNVLSVGISLISFCTKNGFWGLKENDRGQNMALALREKLGLPHPLAPIGGEYPTQYPAVHSNIVNL